MVDVHRWEIREHRGFVTLLLGVVFGIAIHVKHLKTVLHGTGPFRTARYCVFFLRNVLHLRRGLTTLIWIPLDPHTLVNGARHHTGPCEQGVVNGVELQVSITVLKRYFDDDEIMDMIQIFTKAFFGDIWMNVANDEVSGCAYSDLICNMTW